MNENKRIIKAFLILGALFVLLIGYLSYFELFLKADVVQNPYNRRIWEVDTGRVRGPITDRNGVVLAYSEADGEGLVKRIYPFKNLYSHVIGYHSPLYGNHQLEATYQNDLSGDKAVNRIKDLWKQLSGETLYGNQLTLTIDHVLQTRASELLKGRNGAVVALDPRTGAILAMVSNPSFDPNADALSEQWAAHQADPDAVLLPRATQGLYPPGSTFKVLTTAAAMGNGLADFVWNDEGSITVDGKVLQNFNGKVFGQVDLNKAFTQSVNTYFAALGLEVGEDRLVETTEAFHFNQAWTFPLQVATSRFERGQGSLTALASASIGQGTLLMTPLHMALMAGTVANGGNMMTPYLVQSVQMASGEQVENTIPKVLSKAIPVETAQALTQLMIQVVDQGTGTRAKISGIKVAGKTGTAQNERSGEDHAWFVGFAPAADPQIVVAVLLEYSGTTGGNASAPIAADIMGTYLK
jgi:peptidoglycan glycosyltransferase